MYINFDPFDSNLFIIDLKSQHQKKNKSKVQSDLSGEYEGG